MKSFIKQYWKTLLFFGIIGLVGGFFVGIYLLDSYPAEIQQQLIAELAEQGLGDIPVNIALGAITASQALFYGIVLGALGIWLAKKVGLWKDERSFTKKPLLASALVSVFGGSVMILSDILFFGNFSEVIKNSYAVKPTVPYLIGTVTYGAVIEEIMLRLFMMSLYSLPSAQAVPKKQEFAVRFSIYNCKYSFGSSFCRRSFAGNDYDYRKLADNYIEMLSSQRRYRVAFRQALP